MDFKSIAKALPWQNGVKIARVDDFGLVAIDKPCGVLSHPNKKAEIRKSLLDAESYNDKTRAYRLKGDVDFAYLLNRLDSATSGILLLALNEEVRLAALREFEEKKVEKFYEALVFGALRKSSPFWRDRLGKERREGSVRATTGSGNEAETKLISAKSIPGMPLMSRLRMMPITGRTHQLRIQTAKRGVPIVGDRTYGDFNKNKLIVKSKGIKRLCLHCVETRLSYMLHGKSIRFSAEAKCPF